MQSEDVWEVFLVKLSAAEERALAATKLDAFPLQLHEIRRTVKQILDLFGRNGFFAEYTVHDFSHVEAMLADLEWIIPETTKHAMTPADWLLITLAIYFHDLGLVVTEEEFKNRNLAAFNEFCDKVLFAKNDGQDYKTKVETLGPDLSQRFFYQEFVRFNHAKRIRAWIEGTAADELGYAPPQKDELDRLFSGVDTPSTTTCKQVAEFSKFRGAPLPAGNLVTNSDLSSMARALLEGEFEICELRASIADRRIDARWLPSDPGDRRWLSANDVERVVVTQLKNELRAYHRFREDRRRRHTMQTVQLGLKEFPCAGLDNYIGVIGMGAPRLLPATPIAQFLRSLNPLSSPENAVQCLIFMDALGPCFGNIGSDSRALRSEIEFVLKETTARLDGQLQIDITGFLEALAQTDRRIAVFNPWSWERSEAATDWGETQ